MRNLVCAVATCAVILATLGGAVAADVIAERQEAMKSAGGAIKAIKAAVDGDKPANAVAPAETIAAIMKQVTGLFPQGSGEGQPDAKNGRPHCRERVDPYVKIPGGAESV